MLCYLRLKTILSFFGNLYFFSFFFLIYKYKLVIKVGVVIMLT